MIKQQVNLEYVEDLLGDLVEQSAEDKDLDIMSNSVWSMAEKALVFALDMLVSPENPAIELATDVVISKLVHQVISRIDTPEERKAFLDKIRKRREARGGRWGKRKSEHSRIRRSRRKG